jgi:hypothetical protein
MKRKVVLIAKSVRDQSHFVISSILCSYGEGWDFGEVACNGRGENAAQCNLAGTGIGRSVYHNSMLIIFFHK